MTASKKKKVKASIQQTHTVRMPMNFYGGPTLWFRRDAFSMHMDIARHAMDAEDFASFMTRWAHGYVAWTGAEGQEMIQLTEDHTGEILGDWIGG